MQVVTKRGTNAWHGTAYEYYLDNNFSANTWQNNQTNPVTPASELPLQPLWRRDWWPAPSQSARRKDLFFRQLPGLPLA